MSPRRQEELSDLERGKLVRHKYEHVMDGVVKGRAARIDVYLGSRWARRRPLIVFHHIKKTAGTAMRLVIFANHPRARPVAMLLPRGADRPAWWRDFYDSATHRDRLVCVAGHDASYLLALVEDRAVHAATLLRNPVDRVLSRWYFLVGHRAASSRGVSWSLDKLYLDLDAGAGATSTRAAGFCNGQARTILAPHYGTAELPLLADDPSCDLWRKRLFTLVDDRYVLGVQERLSDAVDRFGDRFGWRYRHLVPIRVNKSRPPREELPARTEEMIRRYNWLDDELHRYALRQYESTQRKAS
jgi:hypothetical protein